MNKQVAIKLKSFTQQVCDRYSKKDRANNFNKETFIVQEEVQINTPYYFIICETLTNLKTCFVSF